MYLILRKQTATLRISTTDGVQEFSIYAGKRAYRSKWESSGSKQPYKMTRSVWMISWVICFCIHGSKTQEYTDYELFFLN